MPLSAEGICVQGPVQLVVQMHTYVFVSLHHHNVHPSNVDWRKNWLRPAKINHQLPNL